MTLQMHITLHNTGYKTMLDYEVVKKVVVPTITEDKLLDILRVEIAKQLPADVVITGLNFNIKRQPTRVELDVDAQFADMIIEPAKAETQGKPMNEVLKHGETLGEGNAEEDLEPKVDRDGVPTSEPEKNELLNELLPEDNATAPKKSVIDIFNN